MKSEVKVNVNTPKTKFPYLAQDSHSENIYIVFSGEKSWCDVMCVKVVHGNHWKVFERRFAAGSRLVDLPEGTSVEITLVQ